MDNEAQELSRIQIRSEEVEAILSYIPRWIIRWGITVILVVVVMLFAMATWIEYPDIVYGRVKLSTESLPISIIARSNGKINLLEVAKGDTVERGELLAVIDNYATNYKDFLELKEQVKKWNSTTLKELKNIQPSLIENLGSLQQSYAQLQQNLTNYKDFLKLSQKEENIEALEEEKRQAEKMKKAMAGQLRTTREDIAQLQSKVKRYEKSFEEKAISQDDLEEIENQHLQRKKALETLLFQQKQYDSEIVRLETRITSIKTNDQREKKQYERQIQSDIKVLKGKLDVWEQQNVLYAPIGGRVSMREVIQEQKSVVSNDELFTIIPKNSGDTLAIAFLGMKDLGKVAEEQIVNIKLDSYQHTKYGLLKGRVKNIPLLPGPEDFYETEIELLNGMITNFNKTLIFKPKLSGTAEIITEDATVMERILEQFIELIQ
ncbi:MAG: HlyD family secretion protein [Chitinophagales bacterium]